MTYQPKLSPAQEKSLLTGLANTQSGRLEGRPVVNRSLVSLGYAYYSPNLGIYRITLAGLDRAKELQAAKGSN